MKIYNDIKIIRTLLGLSQDELAKEVGVTSQVIYRWENNLAEPEEFNVERLYTLAFKNKIYLNKLYEQMFNDEYQSDSKVLFHGSKSEIVGKLSLNRSKVFNDFGNGFYLGETFKQASTYISYSSSHNVYAYRLDITDLNFAKFDVSLEWMLAIAFYRGWLDNYEQSKAIKKILDKVSKADVIIAPIADNRMFDLIDDFVNGNITDLQCIHALAVTNLGFQYVIKSNKALDKLELIKRMFLTTAEKFKYSELRLEESKVGLDKVKLARSEYRGKGKYIEEVLK